MKKISLFFIVVIMMLPLSWGCIGSDMAIYSGAVENAVITLQLSQCPDLALDGQVIQLDIEGTKRSLIIVRLQQDNYIALSPVCSLQDCKIKKEGQQFICPCDGSIFSLQGNVIKGPAERPLRKFGVNFDGEQLFISPI